MRWMERAGCSSQTMPPAQYSHWIIPTATIGRKAAEVIPSKAVSRPFGGMPERNARKISTEISLPSGNLLLQASASPMLPAGIRLHPVARGHHAAEEAGKHAPRFRGQCHARAAHAAHVHPRLCGDAAGRRARRSGAFHEVPADHRDRVREARPTSSVTCCIFLKSKAPGRTPAYGASAWRISRRERGGDAGIHGRSAGMSRWIAASAPDIQMEANPDRIKQIAVEPGR